VDRLSGRDGAQADASYEATPGKNERTLFAVSLSIALLAVVTIVFVLGLSRLL